MGARITINGAFRGQEITGQQRYASEISDELARQYPDGVEERVPGVWWQARPLRAWIWSQLLGVARRSVGDYLLTLTSRGPIIAVRHVLVIHDLFVLTNPEWYSKAYVASHAPILRLQLFTAKIIVVVSDPVREQVREIVGKRKRIVVVPNAPAQVFQNELSRDLIQQTCTKYDIPVGDYILSVGSQEPRKNLGRLVEAYLSLPADQRKNCPLVLVGGSSSVFGKVSLIADDSVLRLGYIPDNELAALYAGSRVVAFPSLAEGFGLPAVEALSSGARILVSDNAVMRWVCGKYASYIDPNSTSSIADSIWKCMRQSAPAGMPKAQIRDYVDSRFSWTKGVRLLAAELSLDNDAN